MRLTFTSQAAITLFYPLLAGVILTLLTVWLSGRNATKNARSQNDLAGKLKLADFRQAWINELRNCASELQSRSLEPAPRDAKELERLAHKIRLLMNPKDSNYPELSKLIDELLGDPGYGEVNQMTTLTQTILKTEWEVLKSDLRYESNSKAKKDDEKKPTPSGA